MREVGQIIYVQPNEEQDPDIVSLLFATLLCSTYGKRHMKQDSADSLRLTVILSGHTTMTATENINNSSSASRTPTTVQRVTWDSISNFHFMVVVYLPIHCRCLCPAR